MKEPNELAVISLELNNYRQFYGENKIDFATKEKRFNIIQGENGEGKSNILNAFHYCLYLTEPHLKSDSQGMPIMNTRTLKEAKENSFVEMSIVLTLGNDDIKYKISRMVRAYKTKIQETIDAKGNKKIELQNTPFGVFPVGVTPNGSESFKVSKTGKTWDDRYFSYGVSMMLPKELSPFYFLDGEFLESLHKTFDTVKTGIEQISELTLVFSAIKHLNSLLTTLRKQAKGSDTNIDDQLKRMEAADNWLQSRDNEGNSLVNENELIFKEKYDGKDEYHPRSGYPRLKSKENERIMHKAKLDEIDNQLIKKNAALIKELQKQRMELENKTIPELENTKLRLRKEKLKLLIDFAPRVYLKNCLEYSINLIGENIEKGRLPSKITDIFTQELLDKNECICGTDLSKGQSRERIIQMQKTAKLSKQLDSALEAQYDFKNWLKQFSNDSGRLDTYRRDLIKTEKDLGESQRKLKDISIKLKGSDDEDIAQLEKIREAREKWIDELSEEIGSIRKRIEEYENIKKAAKAEYDRLLKANKKLEQLGVKQILCENALQSLTSVKDRVLEKMRTTVEEKTKHYFFNLIWKKDTYTDVQINDNYVISVKHKHGYDATNNLSAGEKLLLALSFIAAIRDITGFKFPLIVDTPLGKISGLPKMSVAKEIPTYLPETQLVLLVTDTEYASPIVNGEEPTNLLPSFREIINSYVGKEFLLNYNEKEVHATITKMKPLSESEVLQHVK